jgi:hypothetical protein
VDRARQRVSQCPGAPRPGGPSRVAASAGASDTLVERNLFVNCQTGIALGLTAAVGTVDHSGGRIASNFIYRAPLVAGGAGISVVTSPGTVIVHNTVITSHTAPATIAVRSPESTHLVVANNLLDGPIEMLDQAWATQTGNITTATPGLFVYAAAGDLHLRRTASVAIDTADPAAADLVDIDGQPRGLDGGPDVGADEFSQSTATPTVQVSQPLSGAMFKPGTLQVQAATGATTAIAYVDLYINAVAVARLTSAPYVANVSLTPLGVYTLVAVAVDAAGGRAASKPVSIAISNDAQ